MDSLLPNRNSESELVQLSSALLASLISSVQELKRDVSDLRSKVSDLQSNNAELQSTNTFLNQRIEAIPGCSSIFPKFGDLTVEIRCLIWKFALDEPQIHIVGDKLASRSFVNNIMQVSNEARNEALKRDFEYFGIDSNCYITNQIMKSYVSPESIIWLAGERIHPLEFLFFCSSRSHRESQSLEITYAQTPPCQTGLKALAINYNIWQDSYVYNNLLLPGTMELLWKRAYTKLREIYLVVMNNSDMDREVEFVNPSYNPERVLNVRGRYVPGADDWEVLAAQVKGSMEHFKARRARSRAEVITRLGYIPDSSNGEDWYDLSSWEIPSVRFVQARSVSRKSHWVPL